MEAKVTAIHSEEGKAFVFLARRRVKAALRGVAPVAPRIVWMAAFSGAHRDSRCIAVVLWVALDPTFRMLPQFDAVVVRRGCERWRARITAVAVRRKKHARDPTPSRLTVPATGPRFSRKLKLSR